MSQRNSLAGTVKKTNRLAWLCILLFPYGCGAAGQVNAGRQALIVNKPDVALAYFQHAAETDPNYVMKVVAFDQGVWTYLGRAQYLVGKIPEARRSLERAVAQHPDDSLAGLYLGMALARDNDRSRGLQQIESAMKRIYDRIELVVNNKIGTGEFWDPRGEMRSEIQNNLAMIAGREIDWQKLISSGEWLGQQMEEEVEKAQSDKQGDIESGGSG